jgi:hypothetical protein
VRATPPTSAIAEGNAARKLAPLADPAAVPKPPLHLVPPEPVPVVPPETVPVPQAPPVAAPSAAAQAGAKVGTGTKVAIGAGVAAAAAAGKAPKKKRPCKDAEPVEPLPIRWPMELPHTEGQLTRTKGDEREVLGIDRGPNQAAFARCISKWRQSADHMALEDACPGHGFYQEGLFKGENIDAHHIHPLYLGGGDDWKGNLSAIETQRHRLGHKLLDDQTEEFLTNPAWEGVCSPKLSQHPIGQEYEIDDH